MPGVSSSAPPPSSVMTDTEDRDGWGASTSCETAACLAPSPLLQEPRGCFHHPTGTDSHWEGFAAEESPAVPSICETSDPCCDVAHQAWPGVPHGLHLLPLLVYQFYTLAHRAMG